MVNKQATVVSASCLGKVPRLPLLYFCFLLKLSKNFFSTHSVGKWSFLVIGFARGIGTQPAKIDTSVHFDRDMRLNS